MCELNGAFTWRQLTEDFTIPQIYILLKDRPHMEYGKEKVVEINSASAFMGVISKR